MSDSVLAAIIAGTATLSASFLQMRSARLRDGASRSGATRRGKRLQLIVLLIIVGAAGASGFALSQRLTESERAAQRALQNELQARIAEVSRTANQLELTRGSERTEIETGVLRRIGSDGVVALATVAACRPSPAAGAGGDAASAAAGGAGVAAAASLCTEAEASPVTLCVTIPAAATVTEVALFSHNADSDTPWSASRYLAGQESSQARFAEKYTESTPQAGVREVCQQFAHWSSEHARAVRLIVHYALPG